MSAKNRCKCGQSLEKKPLHQRARTKTKKTFKFDGELVKIAGTRLVCKTHGTQKVLYS